MVRFLTVVAITILAIAPFVGRDSLTSDIFAEPQVKAKTFDGSMTNKSGKVWIIAHDSPSALNLVINDKSKLLLDDKEISIGELPESGRARVEYMPLQPRNRQAYGDVITLMLFIKAPPADLGQGSTW